MDITRFLTSFSPKAGILAALCLGGCIATTLPYMRAETAQRIASPAWMIKRDIPASPFALRAYERIHDKGGIAHLYIEGDGAAFTSPGEWEGNPTPKNPVALHLASKDNADNVIYLARPCQYSGMMSKGKECPEKFWKEERFSPAVINAYDKALDEIALRYDITGFHVIGYSGGASIATLLAAKRADILSLRTVAGIMDHERLAEHHNQAPYEGSLNPVTTAATLTKLPQYHFVGGQDKVVPPAILHSYMQSMPPTNCVQTMLVQEAGYDDGWVNKWPELLDLPVRCYGQYAEPALEPTMVPAPLPYESNIFVTKEKPAKP